MSDTELKARHRAMWASGDYPVDGRDLPAARWARARRGLRHRPGDEGPRRRGRNRQRVDPGRQDRGRRHRQRPDARAASTRAARAPRPPASSWSGSRPTPRTCRSRTSPSTSSCPRSARCSRRATSGGRRARPRLQAGRDDRDAQLDARGHDRRAVPHDGPVRAAAAARRVAAAAVGRRGPRQGALRRPRRAPHARAQDARASTAFEHPQDYVEHFKDKYGPTIVARGQRGDERPDRRAQRGAGEPSARSGTWAREDEARFEQEYLVVAATKK